MAIRAIRDGARSLKVRILSLIALGVLSGCASNTLYWGPALSTCKGSGSAERFATKACRNGAEYDIARKKAKHDLRG
jgi:hypothetical protein